MERKHKEGELQYVIGPALRSGAHRIVEDGKARIVERQTADREDLLIRTVAGELFSIPKLGVGEAQIEKVEQIVRDVLRTNRGA